MDEKQKRKERLGQLFHSQDMESLLKKKPTYNDIQNCSFSIENTFQKDEIVIINRSRGGFSFGKISSRDATKEYCIFGGKEYTETTKLWKVIYESEEKKQMRDLPASWIGKIKSENKFGEKSDDIDENMKEDDRVDVGSDATWDLLKGAAFCLDGKIEIGEKVLVAKEDNGFMIGEIESKSEDCSCPFPSHSHDLSGFTVSYGDEFNEDICTFLIMKISNTNGTVVKKEEVKKVSETKKTSSNKKKEVPLKDQPKTKSVIQIPKNEKISSKTSSNSTNSINNINDEPKRKEKVSVTVNKPRKNNKPVVIIDGPSVASKHKKNVAFSSSGLELAIKFFERKGHQAVAFVPQFYLSRKTSKNDGLTLGDFCNVADNPKLLESLFESGKVVLVPPSCNLHSYITNYALKNRDSIILSNNKDLLLKGVPKDESSKENQNLILDNLLSFTFILNDFLPNPDKYHPN